MTGIRVSEKKLKDKLIKALIRANPHVDLAPIHALFDKPIKKTFLQKENEEIEISGNILTAGMLFVSSFLISIIPLGFPPAAPLLWSLSVTLASAGTGYLLAEFKDTVDQNNERKRKNLVVFPELPEVDFEDLFENDLETLINPELMESKFEQFSESFNIFEESVDLFLDAKKCKDINFENWFYLVENKLKAASED